MSVESVCTNCIVDPYLKLLPEQKIGHCNLCGNQGTLVESKYLYEKIHKVLTAFYKETNREPIGFQTQMAKEGFWEPSGQSILEFLEESVVGDIDHAESLRDSLSERYGPTHGDYMDGCNSLDDPYDEDAHYEYKGPDADDLNHEWEGFKTDLKERSRFFHKKTVNFLDEIFHDIEELNKFNQGQLLKTFGATKNDQPIFRARYVTNEKALYELLASLPESIGPPPSDVARNGRMNAQGISTFYGALDQETCIAEIRPPVNSWVVVSEFKVIEKLKVLDIDALLQIERKGSIFDEYHQSRLSIILFLTRLVDEIKKPVIHGENDQDYLTTQFISEYLAQRSTGKIDGLLFKSTQVNSDGTNLVLFHRSSKIKPNEKLASCELDFYRSHIYGPDGPDGPGELVGRITKNDHKIKESINNDDRSYTLECDVENFKVIKINGVKYSGESEQLSWEEDDKSEEF